MRPEFDHHEEYIIAYYRQYGKQAAALSAARDVTTVVIGAVFFGLGYYKDDVTWSVIGFVLVSYLVLRSLISGARYNRTFASLIRKYEDGDARRCLEIRWTEHCERQPSNLATSLNGQNSF